MRQCVSCNTVLANLQEYLEHVKPAANKQCPACSLSFQIECDYELHKLTVHTHDHENTAKENVRPEIASALPDNEEPLEQQSLEKYVQMLNLESSTSSTSSNAITTSHQVAQNFALDNPFDDAPVLGGGTSKKVLISTLLGQPHGDLLDLSSVSTKAETLGQAVTDFQGALKKRNSHESTGGKGQNSEVELKKRFVIPLETTSTGSPVLPEFTPGSSEAAMGSPIRDVEGVSLVLHNQETAAVEPGRIICFECQAVFGNILALHQHQMVEGHNYCQWCFAFFIDRTMLRKHKDQVHNFQCATCDLIHITLGDLITHKQLKGHCYCKPCNSYFENVNSHKQHMSVMHDNAHYSLRPRPVKVGVAGGKYKCTVHGCSFSAYSANTLRTHQEQENHNFCRPCNKAFCDSLALKNHKSGGGRHAENLNARKIAAST
ncbi:hypothetical protein LOZ51_005056 [Ophidiomyces ophidiicola]|nr:hypothetical protein LOZ55_002857 [Ophidiomyces ophidiicola]KAI1989811.1 hypothetical protein LOZ51_005056 [Ophidiomyces ophidiicola]KAI1992458.1 hypothetical protein LOZ54_001672 [Ophidiomyces ophidiicola]